MSEPVHKVAAPIDITYLFSESARRALFFAKYEASRRDTDCVQHHITIEDIVAGIAKETNSTRKRKAAR